MPSLAHPNEALFEGEKPFPALAACVHYAGSEERIAKALELQSRLGPVFDLSCDCEDGARPGAEQEHATMVAKAIRSAANRFGRVGARVHDPDHPAFRDDVRILAAASPAFLVIPKALSAVQAAAAIDVVRSASDRPIPIHLLIETHGALRDAYELAALPGVETLDFGLMDFVSAHHGAIPAWALRSPGQFEHPLVVRAKLEIASAALAHGVIPAHNVTLDFKNPAIVGNDARLARERFGYLRQWSIHPAQIPPIVQAFTPEHGEVESAAAILVAGQGAGWGPIQHQGEMHDKATYRLYWSLLQRAKMAGVAIPPAAQSAFFA